MELGLQSKWNKKLHTKIISFKLGCSREVGYFIWVWTNSEKSCKRQLFSVICKHAIIKLLFAYCFRKNVFYWSNLKHVHMTYYFIELLIFFWLTLADNCCLEFISHYIKEILYVNTNSKGNQSWNTKQGDKHFHLSLILMLKNPVFLLQS